MLSVLIDAVSRHMEANGGGDGLFPTAIDGVCLIRSSQQTLPHHMIYKPSMCIVLQGGKQIMLGKDVLHYRAMQALVVNIDLPAFGCVTQASQAVPFLGIVVEFDAGLLRETLRRIDNPPKPAAGPGLGIFVSDFDGPLADCVLRLIRMLDSPAAIPVLYPGILGEIGFWLLTGPHGGRICKLALPDSHARRIADAIHILRDQFSRAVRIEELAGAARMSLSSFHLHFKMLTGMTPLQYQKQLRLLEARRLMVADAANAETAAYQVGYESPSQFSRDYVRLFGTPPRRDAAGWKAMPA